VNKLQLNKISLNIITPALVFVAFMGAIGRYGFTDDYAGIWGNIEGNINWDLSLSQGRPILVFFGLIRSLTMKSIDSLLYFHIIDILILAWFSYILTLYFKANGIKAAESNFMATFPLILTPGIMLFSAWPSLGVGAPAFIFASLSLIWIGKKYWLAISTILLLFAYLTYPPAANIFVLIPFIVLLSKNLDAQKSFALNVKKMYLNRILIVYILAGFSSLGILKLIASLYPKSERTSLIGPLSEKLVFIKDQALPRIIDPFDFASQHSTQAIAGFFILFFLAIFWFLQDNFFIKIIIAFSGMALSLVPNFLTGENWASNRSLLSSQFFYLALITIGITRLIPNYRTVKILVFSFSLLWACYSTNQILIKTMKNPQIKELNLAREAIKKLDLQKTIHVQKSEWFDTISPQISADEFGLPSSAQPWVYIPLTKILVYEETQGKLPKIIPSITGNGINLLDYTEILAKE
jgi:hypothetical protein